MYTHTVHVCQPPSVSRVYLSRYSSVSTLLYPKISELFLLSNFRKVYEPCRNSLKSRWETRHSAKHGALAPGPTARWLVKTHANILSSPSMAQSSTYMVLRVVEFRRSLLDPYLSIWPYTLTYCFGLLKITSTKKVPRYRFKRQTLNKS